MQQHHLTHSNHVACQKTAKRKFHVEAKFRQLIKDGVVADPDAIWENYYNLKDVESGQIIKRKVIMTISESDKRNKQLGESPFRWIENI